MNKDEIKILNKSENIVDDMENLQTKNDTLDQIKYDEIKGLNKSENIIDDMGNIQNNIAGSDCADILEKHPSTKMKNGVYNIMDSNKTKGVYCDMTTDQGGWTANMFSLSLIFIFEKIK